MEDNPDIIPLEEILFQMDVVNCNVALLKELMSNTQTRAPCGEGCPLYNASNEQMPLNSTIVPNFHNMIEPSQICHLENFSPILYFISAKMNVIRTIQINIFLSPFNVQLCWSLQMDTILALEEK